jgi:hypothetical protein
MAPLSEHPLSGGRTGVSVEGADSELDGPRGTPINTPTASHEAPDRRVFATRGPPVHPKVAWELAQLTPATCCAAATVRDVRAAVRHSVPSVFRRPLASEDGTATGLSSRARGPHTNGVA